MYLHWGILGEMGDIAIAGTDGLLLVIGDTSIQRNSKE
jgi:hypothetical protein